MKRKTGSILLSCVMGAALLSGCTITATSVSEAASQPAAQSMIDGDKTSASSSPDASTATIPPQSETVVYTPGRIAADGDALFEVPSEINADHFHNFALYITVAIQNPIDSIENVDDKTAFRLSRCMLECFYRTHPGIWDQVVYRKGRRWVFIPSKKKQLLPDIRQIHRHTQQSLRPKTAPAKYFIDPCPVRKRSSAGV